MKKIALMAAGLAMAVSLVACGGSDSSSSTTAAPATEAATEAAAADEAAEEDSGSAEAPEIDAYEVSGNLTIGTAASTGTFYYVGAAIGNAVSNAGKLNILVQATAGSNENVAMVQTGDIDIGMGNCDALYGAYTGTLTYEDAGPQDIQEVAALYYSQLHVFVTEKSGITDISELKGKKVCVGSQGTSYLVIDEAVLNAYGITLDDIEPYYMDYAESAEALANGDIDAAFQTGGYPIAGIQQTAATTPFRMLSISDEVCDQILDQFSFGVKTTIPVGTYENQVNTEDTTTLGYMTCLFCSSLADDDQMYAFTKLMVETMPEYQDTNDATRQISKDTIATQFIPFNAGAERYYREAGLLQ